MRQLRDYQAKCIAAVQEAFRRGVKGVVTEGPTGSGKSMIIASVAKGVIAKKKRVLVMVNRDELCNQLHDSLKEQGLWPVMERGQDKASAMSDCVVGSVQTMQGDRLKKWPPNHFHLVICDESHGSAASTFKAVLDYFEASYHWGLSATIARHDKKGLWKGYQECVFAMTLTEAIDQGWLVPFEFHELPVPIVIDDTTATKKTFTPEDEEGVFEKDDYLPRLFAASAAECIGKRALMFWPNCKSSEEASKHFNTHGIESQHIDGYMSKNRIAELLEWFKTPGPKALHNSDLLCLDCETEILTERGFVGIDSYSPLDKVANWWSDGKVTFEVPSEWVCRQTRLDETFVSIESSRINFRVTSNHDMVVGARANNAKWKKVKADDLSTHHVMPTCGMADPFEMEVAQPNCLTKKKRARLISAQSYNLRKLNGYDYKASVIEAARRIDRKHGSRFKNPADLTLDECRFIGFWIADGSITKNADGSTRLTMCQSSVYPEIIKWIDGVLSRCGLDYSRYESHPTALQNPIVKWVVCKGTGGCATDKNGWHYLAPYLNKSGTPLFWAFDSSQFDALLEGYWYGDGLHGQAEHGFPDSLRFNDTKLEWLELLQAIGSCRWWRADIRKATVPTNPKHNQQWVLTMRRGANSCISHTTKIKKQPANGERVWCVSVASQCIITRRKGKVLVMGNSYGYDNPLIDCVGIMRLSRSVPMLKQRLGRGTRPACRVDDYPTAELRRQAIAQSEKPKCIAEGSMVLTNKGEVPIEDVTLDMKVWDGSCFVSHEGVVCNGERETITYSGLTATPDHRCWTIRGWKTLAECKQEETPLAVTGIGGHPIRETDSLFIGDSARHGCYQDEAAMSGMRRAIMAQPIYCASRAGELQEVFKDSKGSVVVVQATSGRSAALRKSQKSSLSRLWRQRDKVLLQISTGSRVMGDSESWLSSRYADRQEGQLRELRTGQSSVGNEKAEHVKYPLSGECGGVSQIQIDASRDKVCRRNASEDDRENDVSGNNHEVLPPIKQTKRRVWDILNCGPGNRFTVNGVLVHNCKVLDLMIQLGDVKNTFADATALITDNEDEREYLRQERSKGNCKFTAEELASKLRAKKAADHDKMLAKLATDAANAALRAECRRESPYIDHILRRVAEPHWKLASEKQMWLLKKLGYQGRVPSGWHAHRIIEAYQEFNARYETSLSY